MFVVDSGAGGSNAGKVDVVGNDLFAGQMAAAFCQDLVFDVEGGNVRADVLFDCLGDCHRAWNNMWLATDVLSETVKERRREVEGEYGRHTSITSVHIRYKLEIVRV